VSFITDVAKDRSECIIVDAQRIEDGPVATILLPHRISSGTHSCWADDAATKVVSPPAPRPRL
jgi:carotenoid cleavage dioxygenase